jgi:hypothetical protein
MQLTGAHARRTGERKLNAKILVGDREQSAHGLLARRYDLTRAFVPPADDLNASRHINPNHVEADGVTEKLLQGAQNFAGGDNRDPASRTLSRKSATVRAVSCDNFMLPMPPSNAFKRDGRVLPSWRFGSRQM